MLICKVEPWKTHRGIEGVLRFAFGECIECSSAVVPFEKTTVLARNPMFDMNALLGIISLDDHESHLVFGRTFY